VIRFLSTLLSIVVLGAFAGTFLGIFGSALLPVVRVVLGGVLLGFTIGANVPPSRVPSSWRTRSVAEDARRQASLGAMVAFFGIAAVYIVVPLLRVGMPSEPDPASPFHNMDAMLASASTVAMPILLALAGISTAVAAFLYGLAFEPRPPYAAAVWPDSFDFLKRSKSTDGQ
jgi:hypothetical protein